MTRTIDRLAELLRTHDGPISRKWLETKRKEIESSSQSAKTGDGIDRIDDPDDLPNDGVSAEVSGGFSGLLLTPSSSDVGRLVKDFASELPLCLSLADHRADDAGLVMIARIDDLLRLADKLPCWGFAKFSGVYLMQKPDASNLLNCKAVAVSTWGRHKPNLDEFQIISGVDEVTVATGLLPTDGRRLHLFAKSSRQGWETFIGQANWAANNDAADA